MRHNLDSMTINVRHLWNKPFVLVSFKHLVYWACCLLPLTFIVIHRTLHITVKALLTQNLMRALFLLFYLGTSLIGHLFGKYGRSITLAYLLEVTVFPYESYEVDRKCCVFLFKI
jgi:hypothetical protein